MAVNYTILVVGAGGTGSCFLQKFARFQAALNYMNINVVVIDGDRVERKNLKRQNFFDDSIGKYKSENLVELAADSYGLEWGAINSYVLEINNIVDAFRSIEIETCMNVKILIGCVDNHAARRVMESWFEQEKDCIYIDSANDEFDGEIIVSAKARGSIISPLRSFYFPDVLTDDSPSVVEESCEVRNQSSPQHQATNDLAGNIILSLISQILERNIPTGMIVFDSRKFSLRRFPFEEGGLRNE